MPNSALYFAIVEFQKSILRNERRTASEMVRVYAGSWKKVKAELNALQIQYEHATANGEDVGLNWFYRNNRMTDLQALVVDELNRFVSVSGSIIGEAQRRVIAESLDFSRDEMILMLGADYDLNRFLKVTSLPTAAIEVMVGVNQPNSPLKRLLNSISAEGSKAASDALIEGVILGFSPRKIATIIRDSLGVQLNRALTISRTEVMRAQRLAAGENYKANADVIKGWRWQAEMSGACPACLAMNGTEHQLSEKMASHPNCRCVAVPITLSWEAIVNVAGVDFGTVDKEGPTFKDLAEKYNMPTAQVERYTSRGLSGEEFFRTLSVDDQIKRLGRAKWQAWNEGLFEFNHLSRPTYSPLWGGGIKVASLKDLIGEDEAKRYLDEIKKQSSK